MRKNASGILRILLLYFPHSVSSSKMQSRPSGWLNKASEEQGFEPITFPCSRHLRLEGSFFKALLTLNNWKGVDKFDEILLKGKNATKFNWLSEIHII